MNLVMILTDDDGDKIDKPVWCYVDCYGDAERTFCDGQVFGMGESAKVTYKEKEVKRGGITCKRCLRRIKEVKAIKL